MTLLQMCIITTLEKNKTDKVNGLSIYDIADCLKEKKITVNSLQKSIKPLQKNGFVDKTLIKIGKRNSYYLTEKGRVLLKELLI